MHRAVIHAGPVRLRTVLATVLATVGGLIPAIAIDWGPTRRQLVYVQVGGLLLAPGSSYPFPARRAPQ